MGKNYDFLKQNGYLEYNEKPNFGGLKSGRAYDLFMSTITGINKEVSDLLFGDLDFSGFALYGKNIE